MRRFIFGAVIFTFVSSFERPLNIPRAPKDLRVRIIFPFFIFIRAFFLFCCAPVSENLIYLIYFFVWIPNLEKMCDRLSRLKRRSASQSIDYDVRALE